MKTGDTMAHHWSQRPLPLLAAAMAAKSLVFVLSLAASLPILLMSGQEATGWPLAVLVQAAQIAIALAVGLLFLRWITEARRRQGLGCAVDWRLGVPFWLGLALALAYGVLGNYEYAQYRPAEAVGNFLSLLAQGFASTVPLALVFPALERRFGVVRSALLLLVASSLLTVVELTAFRALAGWLALGQGTASFFPLTADHLLFSHLLSDALSAVAAVVAVAAYLSAGRRVPGAWLLAVSVNGLLRLLRHVISSSLIKTDTISAAQTSLAVDLPFGLVVLALGLLLLAVLGRWKTFSEFAGSVRRLADRIITMQDDQ